MDAIITDLLKKWLVHYNRDYSDNLTPHRVLHFDLHHAVKPECGEKVYDYLDLPGFFSDLEPLAGSLEALTALHADGHEIIITTAPSKGTSCPSDKIAWILERLPITRKDILLGHKKHLHKRGRIY